MSRPGGGEHRDGALPAGEPGSFDPGLDHLIRALTASGHPHEQAGRDTALTAFRAASRPPRPAGLAARLRGSGRQGYPGRPRRPLSVLLPARLAAVSAAGLVALGGVAAAAYAQALPAPVQRIAHSVLAPLGVPASQPSYAAGKVQPSGAGGPSPSYPVSATTSAASAASSASSASSGASASAASSASAGASGQASPPAPALGIGHYAITLTATRARVPAGSPDLFTGRVGHLGHAAADIHVRLLERVAGSSSWQLVATGITGSRGRVRLWGPSMTASATFRLAGPGGARSAPVRVTVPRPVRLRLVSGKVRDHLIVTAPDAIPGETVSLMARVSGTWETVASKPLGPKLRADFALPAGQAAGHFYRASLPASATSASATPPSATSNRVWIPRLAGTGATQVTPTVSPTPSTSLNASSAAAPSPAASPSGTPTPAPTPSSSATPTPAPTSSSSATPAPEPSTTPAA